MPATPGRNQCSGTDWLTWVRVGAFNLSYSNGQVKGRSTHTFEVHNYSDEDELSCSAKYEHTLQKQEGNGWIPVAHDRIGPENNPNHRFEVEEDGQFSHNDMRSQNDWDNVRRTSFGASSGEVFRIEAYTAIYDDAACKVTWHSDPFPVP